MACRQNLVPLVIAEANRQGVDQAIALAVARRETGVCHWWKNGRVKIGKDGEVGVMQVMPSTAPRADIYDAYENIRAGVGYLAEMYRQFGSWPLAVAAYNWGPGKVEKALQRGTSMPSVVQAYVREVTGTKSVTPAYASATQVRALPAQHVRPSENSEITAGTWFAIAGAATIGIALLT